MPFLKTLVPLSIKQTCKQFLRKAVMLANGGYFKLAANYKAPTNCFLVKKIEQSLNSTTSSTNKKHNLQLAISKLHNLVIEPNQVFSFWHLVGNPSTKNGYEKSRAIIGNQLQQTVGGGLCQLSGLIYFLALHAGMQITERHPHSKDIYTDEERFTPLGSDATVVYGYKDLQFKNTQPHPIYLQFVIADDVLTGSILSSKNSIALTIVFTYQKTATSTLVTTTISSNNITLNSFSTAYQKI